MDFAEIWERNQLITTTNRWTDYILGKIVPRTTEQDTATENLNWRETGAAT